jgi:hypothetical protein
MKFRLHSRQRAAKAGRHRAPEASPEAAAVTWVRAQLRERMQRAGAALTPAAEPANRQTRVIDRSPLADREAQP